jgi:hypothetical protein
MNKRFLQLSNWLGASLRLPVQSIQPLAGDASFRHYYRATLPNMSYIVMDAPPDKEDCKPFIAIDAEFIKAGVHAPAIIASNLTDGFLLLEDFGNTLLFAALNETSVDSLYRQAIHALIKLQSITSIKDYQLPPFDAAHMQREMQLFTDWFVEKELNITLSGQERQLIQQTFTTIIQRIEAQPYTCVHRDYHSRNLMILADGDLGILDFQDAVWGPITYDLISLLKDCYIVWPRTKVLELVGYYHHLATAHGMLHNQSLTAFIADFDWVGIQRHLKVIGIFSRLHLRDHKPGYLKDIPTAMKYLIEALELFDEFTDFCQWLKVRIIPAMHAAKCEYV